jgi:hypothetical protein
MGRIHEVPHYCPECKEWRIVRIAQKSVRDPVKRCLAHRPKRVPQIGRTLIDANGYVRLRVGPGRSGLVYEHRWVWEQAHGPIPAGFHVHHVNEIKADNRLENLALRDGRAHVRAHTTARHANGTINKLGRVRHDIDDALIVRRRAEGASFRQISRELGISHPVVIGHYRRAIA